MNIGSLTLINNKNNYTIQDNSDNSYYNFLIDSFSLPFKGNFYASNVCNLEQFIETNSFSILTANKLLFSLYNQIHHLQQYNIAISFIDITDILVIDGINFYFCNCDKLYPIVRNNITITDVYDKKNMFLSPEFKSNDKLPFITNSNSYIYSLALIVLYCIKQTNSKFIHCTNKEILDHYKSTKLYSILSLALINNPEKKTFVIF